MPKDIQLIDTPLIWGTIVIRNSTIILVAVLTIVTKLELFI